MTRAREAELARGGGVERGRVRRRWARRLLLLLLRRGRRRGQPH